MSCKVINWNLNWSKHRCNCHSELWTFPLPATAKTVPFVILLCLTPDNFTHQWRASVWKRVDWAYLSFLFFNLSSPRPAKTVPFVIFTLSNARRFYSSKESPWVGKGGVWKSWKKGEPSETRRQTQRKIIVRVALKSCYCNNYLFQIKLENGSINKIITSTLFPSFNFFKVSIANSKSKDSITKQGLKLVIVRTFYTDNVP